MSDTSSDPTDAALPIALQLYTVRNVMKCDFAKGLKQVADIGYEYVELAGLGDHGADEVKGMLDDVGLKACSAHVSIDRLNNDIDGVIGEANTLGCEFAVVSSLGEEHRTPAGYANVKRFLTELSGEIAERGVTLGYHNHNFEFEILENGQRGMDILFDPASGTAVKSELDVYWVRKAGDDPMGWVEQLAGRLPLLHVKDMNDQGGFAEIGAGGIDFSSIIKAAPSLGVQYLIVEQDSNWVDDDPMKSAEVSFNNLKKLVG